ncbi:metallophosphoesterase [Rhizobium sp. KVB221]|uniref:Metallophosphoesterase n=1 Tax=Rhizobium setariae TaxID=2801340 RepID=A0A936YJF1_9HYPH|nr:metallophosphoesterase [Rhizobium setariae]MBL0371278.1 metallophosphoesterase [Rhizobium setariae]
MKLIHISDIHINSSTILGHDPVENFKRCLAHVEEFQADADRIVITGDLTHRGQEESYHLLKSLLAKSPLQGKLAPRLLIGNHDSRTTYAGVFDGAQRDANGFVQWTEETEAGLFVYIDTAEPGTHAGHYCAARRAWLTDVLESARQSDRPVWLFMHHNPIAVEVANADEIGIVQEAEFQAILRQYRDTVRHIFFGHCHFTLSGQVCGIPFSAPRSTNHACWPDFSGIVERMGYGALAPNYNVCFLGSTGTIIHSIDFLDAGKVLWVV